MNPIIAALVILGPGSVDVTLERSGGWTSIKYAGSAPFHRTKSPVKGLDRVEVPGGSFEAVTWREGVRTFAAVTRMGGQTRVGEQSGLLRLRFGDFDPTVKALPTPANFDVAEDNDMFVVQFRTQALPEYRTAIEGLGGTIEQYLPDDAYVVRVAPGQVSALRAMDFVRWVGAYQTSWRVEPEIQQAIAGGTLGTRDYYIQVGGDSPARKEVVMTKARLIGAGMQETPSEGSLFRVTLTPDQVGKVAALNGVLWVERHTEPSGDMANVRVVAGANYVETAGGYTGTGVRAHVIDAGILRTHVAYAPRLTVRGNPGVDSHGTATSGIVSGDGTGDVSGLIDKGMMPTSNLIFSAYTTNWNGASRLLWTQDTVNVHNCVVESNSWGDALTGSYTSISSYMDEIVYKTGLLICNSMSNWGNNTQVRPQAWAKNILSVGGFNHFNNQNVADDRWQNTASIGPAADGRIKPELAYYYDSIDCPTTGSNTAYTTGFGGTSAATPMTAGAFGLLFQMWGSGEFGNVANGGSVFANRASSTTIKALMIAGASRYENQFDINRNVQGWGRANLQNVYDRRNDTFWVDESDVLEVLQSKSYTIYVAPGAPSLLATMTYNDYWAAAGANPTRVNVLSLKVVGPSGTTYWGNNGMTGFQNWTVAGGAADTRNNTQNVFIQNPPSGLYTVTVSADSLPQDGRPETASVIDADYGLAVVGGANWIVPTSMAVYKPGALVSGGVAELNRSDNARVVLQTPLMPGGAGLAESGVVIDGTAPSAALPALRLKVEGSSTINNTPFRVYFRNFTTGLLELVGSGTRGPAESETTFGAAGDVTRFVETGTNKVQAVIVFERNTAVPAPTTWQNTIDLARWIVSN